MDRNEAEQPNRLGDRADFEEWAADVTAALETTESEDMIKDSGAEPRKFAGFGRWTGSGSRRGLVAGLTSLLFPRRG